MDRKPVKSGAIAEVGYSKDTRTLEVMFPSKAVWRYFDFPPEKYVEFMRSESLGRYFACDIRACFKSERVHDGDCTPECFSPTCPCWHHHTTKSGENHAKDIPNPSLSKELKRSIKAAKGKRFA